MCLDYASLFKMATIGAKYSITNKKQALSLKVYFYLNFKAGWTLLIV